MIQDQDDKFSQALLEVALSQTYTEHLRPLLDLAHQIAKEHFSLKDLIVFSSPLEHFKIAQDRPEGWLRTIYGRKSKGKGNIESAIKEQWQKKNFSKTPTLCTLEGERYHFVPFGKFDDQFIFALSAAKEDDQVIPPVFSKFLQKGLNEIQRWKEVSRFESLIYVDDVTLLFNQRKLIKDIEAAVESYKTSQEDFSVLFIDIDHFKSVNDNHGHLVGTQILADVASVLRGLLRDTDHCYRYGGDEFVILVPNTTPDNAKMIGHRILKTIKGREFKIDTSKLMGRLDDKIANQNKESLITFNLSVSVGVASFPRDAGSAQEILGIADQMMYQAKKSGRGQVCFADEMFKTGS